jgi:hypothetical protein
MLIAGGEYNPFNPPFWNGNIGFNLELFNVHVQDELVFGFGGITVKDERDERPQKLLFSVRDNFFYSLDGEFIGLRAGISAAFGAYDITGLPKVFDLFFSAAGLVGICVLPKSLISITLDICPGYAMAFRIKDTPDISDNEMGFMLPIALGIRLNMDKF